jgi:hypothetical protein
MQRAYFGSITNLTTIFGEKHCWSVLQPSNCMEQNPLWEGFGSLLIQDILPLLSNPKFHDRIHNNPTIMSQSNPLPLFFKFILTF